MCGGGDITLLLHTAVLHYAVLQYCILEVDTTKKKVHEGRTNNGIRI